MPTPQKPKAFVLFILIAIPFLLKAQTPNFCGNDLNMVNLTVQNFIQSNLGMVSIGGSKFEGKGDSTYLTTKYIQQATMGGHPPVIYVKYRTRVGANYSQVVSSCEVSGNYKKVIDFYVQFWPTTISIDAKKSGEISQRYFAPDRIILYIDLPTKIGKIIISPMSRSEQSLSNTKPDTLITDNKYIVKPNEGDANYYNTQGDGNSIIYFTEFIEKNLRIKNGSVMDGQVKIHLDALGNIKHPITDKDVDPSIIRYLPILNKAIKGFKFVPFKDEHNKNLSSYFTIYIKYTSPGMPQCTMQNFQ